jgi:hypothetical protein
MRSRAGVAGLKNPMMGKDPDVAAGRAANSVSGLNTHEIHANSLRGS